MMAKGDFKVTVWLHMADGYVRRNTYQTNERPRWSFNGAVLVVEGLKYRAEYPARSVLCVRVEPEDL